MSEAESVAKKPRKPPIPRGSGVILSPAVKAAAVDFVARNGSPSAPALSGAIGVSHDRVRRALLEDPIWREQIQQARARFMSTLEKEAIRRAVRGVEEEKIGPGGIVTTVTKYSDALLMFLMKGNDPDKYGDRVRVDKTETKRIEIGFAEMPTEARLKILEAIDLASPEIKNAEYALLEGSPADGQSLPQADLPGVLEAGGSEDGAVD